MLTELQLNEFVVQVAQRTMGYLFSVRRSLQRLGCGLILLKIAFGIAAMICVIVEVDELFMSVIVLLKRGTLISQSAEFGVRVSQFI
jgi:hypothetical protein